MSVDRPAFYALRGGGWRDLVTLLHLPYTLWNVATVGLGAAVAPVIHPWRLAATMAAFFLAVGVSAHALDELHGRPLATGLSDRTLRVLAALGLAGAIAIGAVVAVDVSLLLVPLIVCGGLFVPAYNLELAGGRFHSELWLALGWGGFTAFTGYFANALEVRPDGLLVTVACCLFLAAQRRLSTPVRELRRRTLEVAGQQRLRDGTVVELTRERLAAPLDGALSLMWVGFVVLAAGLLAYRLG
ncbi:MAG TPA: hypothetical protein VL977_05920 [Solirubrobacteraceae bacterium]|nr:hypothetical protein [Solirubrobacteraceae bacterium]